MLRHIVGWGLVTAMAVACTVEVDTGGSEESDKTSSTTGTENTPDPETPSDNTAPPEVRYFLLDG